MKLLNCKACCLALQGGNVKKATVMGEVGVEGLSDRSSILLISILKTPENKLYCLFSGVFLF